MNHLVHVSRNGERSVHTIRDGTGELRDGTFVEGMCPIGCIGGLLQ